MGTRPSRPIAGTTGEMSDWLGVVVMTGGEDAASKAAAAAFTVCCAVGVDAVLKAATGLKLLRAAVPPVVPETAPEVPVTGLMLSPNAETPPVVAEVPVTGMLVKLGVAGALKSPKEAVPPTDPELPVTGVLVKLAGAA